jgi:glycosyltransferase involved in cell wall biosynthesis
MVTFSLIKSNNYKYVVDVVMLTYNQEQYISQAIESVLSQECNFTYRLIIANDCSTDNTRRICEKYRDDYPDIILFINNPKNVGLMHNYFNAFKKVSAKYIAIIEGDDYWIDQHKLQIQVDYLQKHEKVGLVHTNLNRFYVEENLVKYNVAENIPEGNVFDNLLSEINFVSALTVMFRSSLLNFICFEDYLKLNLKTLDYILWLDFAKFTQFDYLNCTTAVYRFSNKSISHSTDYEDQREYIESIFKTKEYICNKYGVDDLIIKGIYADNHWCSLWLALRYNRHDDISRIKKTFPIKNFKYLIMYILACNSILRYLFFKLFYV